ncbi:MAG: GTP 3',8-cyclase MoaA [Gammaproteobacteria bacterium]|nr:GTP 3',8-cyclase MoaA [Gammaproteobacteria bacterium]
MKLIDQFGRCISYVRISITDRCNFRCTYCMGDKTAFVPRDRLMTLEELYLAARAFCELGVGKIRFTGGEPLVRHNALWLFRKVSKLPGLREQVLTTNGSQLGKRAKQLREAGIRRLNISLDTLKPERFRHITRTGDLRNVLRGIDAAKEAGFEHIKINAVVLKNHNHDEVTELVRFAVDKELDITFIEEMPMVLSNQHDLAYYSSDAVKRDLEQCFELIPSAQDTGGPARYFKLPGAPNTRIGFISPHSHNFCDTCNRVRLTTEGKLLLCLGQEHSVDLRKVIRDCPGDLDRLKQAIVNAMTLKPRGHEFNHEAPLTRNMNVTGG